jgi:LacI family transcriptional regulator
MTPTIIDVAAAAGVSKSTVSLVLQDSPLVKATTREAVRKAMADLGYVYNAAAAGLRGGRVQAPSAPAQLPDAIPVSCDLHDPLVATFVAALQSVAGERGMNLAILSNASQISARKITTRFSEAAAPNCIFALHPMGSARMQEGLAAGQATRHLLGLGAGPVAFVGGEEFLPIHAQRMRGYNERMTRAGLEPLLITGGDDFSFGKRSLARMLSDFPQHRAALCINDQVALGMMEGLRERGIIVGDGFRVVGWGDTPVAETLGLSSLRPEIGKLAEVCVDWVLNGGSKAHEIPLTLIRRISSTGGA